jgi:hypothetical protein
MANLTWATLAKIGWEIMNHPPYSPDIAPSYFHLFGPMKVNVGQKFQTDDEVKRDILNWLRCQDKTFHAGGISNLPGRWKNNMFV